MQQNVNVDISFGVYTGLLDPIRTAFAKANGVKVVFGGTPREMVRKKSTLTGKHLAVYVAPT